MADELESSIGSIVSAGFSDAGQPAAPADAGNPQPAAQPAPAQETAFSEAPAQGQPAQPAAANPWEQFLAPEGQQPPAPEDPWARFTRDGLDQINDPAKLRAEVVARQDFLEGNKDKLTTYEEWSKLADDLGGAERVPTALNLVKDLFWGNEPLDPARPGVTHFDQFVAQLRTVSPQTYAGLVQRIVEPMLDPQAGGRDYEIVRDMILESLGLPPQMVDQFQQVVRAGGLQGLEIDTQVSDFLGQIPDHLHEMFRQLPPHVQKDFIARDPKVAEWELSKHHQAWQREQADVRAQASRQSEQQVAQNFETEKTFYGDQVQAVQGVVNHFKAQGLSELEAMGAAAMAFMEMEKSFWSGDRDAANLYNGWRKHVQDRSDLGMRTARGEYQRRLQSKTTEILRAEASRRLGKSAAAPAQTNGAQRPALAPQFAPDQPGITARDIEDLPNQIRQHLTAGGFSS